MGNKIEPPIEIPGNPTPMDYENFPFDLLSLPGIQKVAAKIDFCPYCGKTSLFTRDGFCIRCEIEEPIEEPLQLLPVQPEVKVDLDMVGT
ncbi:hypothetical protein JW758_01925 [Candidatus Peregrinibacteria bacterium]|nr:hypothetical protein [Candidatus Peregrinibacteria bacterium]